MQMWLRDATETKFNVWNIELCCKFNKCYKIHAVLNKSVIKNALFKFLFWHLNFFTRAKASGKPVRKSEDKPDGLFNGYISIVKPNAAWRQRVLVLYGIISGIGWVFQGMAGPLSLSNWLWTAGLLSLRGRKEEGPMRMGRRRMMDKKQLVAFPLGFFIFIIGYSLGNFVTKVVPTLTGNRIEKPLQCLITCLFSGIAVAYIQIDGKNNGKDPSVNDDE